MPEVNDAQRQERRKKAGDLLKMADKLFKGSDIEGAARLVNMAMETDPQNAYALAYQERVKYAIAQRDGQRLDAPRPAKPGASGGPAGGDQAKAPAAPHPSPEEIKKKLEQAQRNIAEERARTETVTASSGTERIQKYQSIIQELQTEIETLKGDLQKLQAEAQNAVEAGRAQWNLERDGINAEWEQRVSEERQRLEQLDAETEQRFEAAATTLRTELEEGVHARAILQGQLQHLQEQLDRTHSASEEERQKWEAGLEEATLQRDTAQSRVQELEATLTEAQGRFEEERKNWLAERDSKRASAEHQWVQRLAEEQTLREATETELQNRFAALMEKHDTLVEQFQNLQQQHEEVVARFSGGQARWESERQSLQEGMREEAGRKLEEERLRLEQVQARRAKEDLDAWESRLQAERARWDNERKEAERALQSRHMAELSAVKEQLQALAQSRKQEESQSLQDLRRSLEQESAQRLDTASKTFQEERQRMEQEMQSRLAAELHRQGDLRRERDELLTQFDSHRATSETERRRLEEEFQNRIHTERMKAGEEMQERLEERFKQEQDALERSARAAVETEMEKRFGEERAALVREQQRLEDEVRRLNDKHQLEAQEGEAARSQVEEFQKRLAEEQHVQEKRSQEALDAAQQRWKTDQERQLEEVRAGLVAEYERKLEKERQTALELRNRDQNEALETRRGVEEQLRKEFEAALMSRLKEERERFQSEYQDRMEGERARLESELRSAFDVEAQKRSDEEDRIAREDRRAHEEKERERRKEEEARKYEDAVRQAIDEGRHKAHLKKIASHMEQASVLLKKKKYAQALEEVARIFTLDPSHEEGLALQHAIRAAQAEHDRRQEEVQRLQEEQKRRIEEMQLRLKEQENKDRGLQKERAAREETVAQRIARAAEYRRLGALDRALTEVQAVLTIDPGNGEAQDMEISILTQLKGHKEVRAAVARRTEQGGSERQEDAQRGQEESVHRDYLREESAQVYRSMLKRAWMQGVPGRDTRGMLDVARVSLGINDNDHTILQRQVQMETYREALEMALEASLLEIDDVDAIDGIRSKYDVDTKAHEAIIASLRRRTS